MIRKPLRPLARILKARATGQNPDEIEAENRAVRQAEIDDRAKTRAKSRLRVMACTFVLAYGAVGVKMAMLSGGAVQDVPSATGSVNRILSQRADIVDRQGRVLATNLSTHALYAQPPMMVDPAGAARKLVKIFPDLDADRLTADFTGGKRKFIWIKRKISPEQMQAVHDIGEPGLLFGPREMRIYPNGHVASHILGGSTFGAEGVSSAEVLGMAGVEKAYDSWLRDPGNNGAPLRLSIDLTAQAAMEQVLGSGMKVMNAKGATAILMDVKSGEIVAMASLPDFDPNDRPRALTKGDASDSPLFNRAVQGQYELGSTFKIFPVAQAMDQKLINANSWINTRGPIKIGKYQIRDMHPYGDSMTVTDIIVKSSNVGTVRIAQMLGAERQQAFLKNLGFFAPTPIEMSEAPTGKPLVPTRWPAVTAATVSFGHGLAASPLHLATAYATIANDGYKVTPTLIHHDKVVQGEQVMSPRAAQMARALLRQVVTRGTAKAAEVAGYEVGGKTGTADKPRKGGGYYQNKVVATFASMFPAEQPKYVLVVTLDEPTAQTAGGGEARVAGATAAPVAAQLVERLSPILGLAPVDDVKLPVIAPRAKGDIKLSAN